jgi:hypothetical protein
MFQSLTLRNPGYLGFAYARLGRREEAEKLAAAEAGRPYRELLIYAGLGDKTRTFEALDRLVVMRDERASLYITSPELALIRGDSRLKALRKKMGLPE